MNQTRPAPDWNADYSGTVAYLANAIFNEFTGRRLSVEHVGGNCRALVGVLDNGYVLVINNGDGGIWWSADYPAELWVATYRYHEWHRFGGDPITNEQAHPIDRGAIEDHVRDAVDLSPRVNPDAPLTIATVAAAVIAEIAELTIANRDLAYVTSFAELHEHLDANMLGDPTLAAYERSTDVPFGEWAHEYQELVTEWLADRAFRRR